MLFGIDAKKGEILWQHAHQGGSALGAQSLVPVPVGENGLFLAHGADLSQVVTITPGLKEAVQKQWESRGIRQTYCVAVHHEGYLYSYSSRFLTCVNAATGETEWKSRAPGDGLIALVDDHLVLLTKKGTLHLAKASPEGYQEVASLGLFDDVAWSHPSYANGHILARGLNGIARVKIERGAATQVVTSDSKIDSVDSPFGRFLKEVASADNKAEVIDQFLAEQKSFPIIEEGNRVHFVYRGPATDMVLGGDLVGSRQEVPMQRVEGTDLFYYSTTLEPDARINYLFQKDFGESFVDPLNDRKIMASYMDGNFGLVIGSASTEVSWLGMPQWTPPLHLSDTNSTQKGKLKSHKVESAHLEKPFYVRVYTPAGYNESAHQYPSSLCSQWGRSTETRPNA